MGPSVKFVSAIIHAFSNKKMGGQFFVNGGVAYFSTGRAGALNGRRQLLLKSKIIESLSLLSSKSKILLPAIIRRMNTIFVSPNRKVRPGLASIMAPQSMFKRSLFTGVVVAVENE